jgi:hypothetical protein
MGALMAAGEEKEVGKYYGAFCLLTAEMPLGLEAWQLAEYNNSHTKEEVIALFDRAIAKHTRKTDAELVAELMQRIKTSTEPVAA